jgi:hypothetical protein
LGNWEIDFLANVAIVKFYMKKILLPLLLFVSLTGISISVNAQKPTTPLQLNDYFAEISDSLFRGGKAWGTQFNKVSTSKDYASLIPFRLGMEQYSKKMVAELTSMKDIKNSKDFRLAVIGFLNYEVELMTQAFIPIEKLNAKSSKEAYDAAIANLVKLAEKEKDYLATIAETQKAYADANGFTIEQ